MLRKSPLRCSSCTCMYVINLKSYIFKKRFYAENYEKERLKIFQKNTVGILFEINFLHIHPKPFVYRENVIYIYSIHIYIYIYVGILFLDNNLFSSILMLLMYSVNDVHVGVVHQ